MDINLGFRCSTERVDFLHEVTLSSTQPTNVSVVDTIVEIVSIEMENGTLTDPEDSRRTLPVISSGIREGDVAVPSQGLSQIENLIKL